MTDPLTRATFQLSSHFYDLKLVDGKSERIEFTAYDMDRAVQAMADRYLEDGKPIDTIRTEDGRLFRINNPDIQPNEVQSTWKSKTKIL